MMYGMVSWFHTNLDFRFYIFYYYRYTYGYGCYRAFALSSPGFFLYTQYRQPRGGIECFEKNAQIKTDGQDVDI
jgi:hypothetical protein